MNEKFRSARFISIDKHNYRVSLVVWFQKTWISETLRNWNSEHAVVFVDIYHNLLTDWRPLIKLGDHCLLYVNTSKVVKLSTPVSLQERFPPNIYYKIYTHRPIQDLCANAPRNYTTSATKQKDMKCSHNKNFVTPKNGKKLHRTTVGITWILQFEVVLSQFMW